MMDVIKLDNDIVSMKTISYTNLKINMMNKTSSLFIQYKIDI